MAASPHALGLRAAVLLAATHAALSFAPRANPLAAGFHANARTAAAAAASSPYGESPARMTMALPRRVALPDIPIPRYLNPFDWSVDRPQRFVVEGQELYRMIGVAPETDFDEIKATVKELSEAAVAAGDPKRKIKLEIAQDKIMELRLRQASAGKLQMTGETLYKNNLISARDEQLAARNKILKAPKWTKGLIQYPTKKYALECAKFIGIFTAAGGVFMPGLATPMTAFICFTGMNNVYKRNRPKKFSEEGMPGVRIHRWPSCPE